MSLDKSCAIPVDTHVFQIAKTYLPALAEKKSVTHRIYSEISIFFQELYGPYAGWAHTVSDFCTLIQKKIQKRSFLKKK